MKVLALVVLVVAISGLEAGVVKREAEDPFQAMGNYFQDFAKNIQEKFTNGEIPAQAQELGAKIQEQTATLTAQFQKWIEELTVLGQQKLS
ncbi:apolipoprotein A-II [Mantella aurantiaca]